MKRVVTSKGPAYYLAECVNPACCWWDDGYSSAQAGARAHAHKTGHQVRCETTVVRNYSSAKQPSEANAKSQKRSGGA